MESASSYIEHHNTSEIHSAWAVEVATSARNQLFASAESLRQACRMVASTTTPYFLTLLLSACLAADAATPAQMPSADDTSQPLYRRSAVPIEERVDDLLGRMTLEEKARQLDMYTGATELVSRHRDDTHATADAVFLPEKAEQLFGNLGVGSIHDLNPTPTQYNTIQQWVIAHNRLGIPALFIEEGLHGFDTGTVFPSPLGLAATWDPEVAKETGSVIASEARSTGVGMILGPVLDLARDPRWGRVEEDMGEDPYLTGQLGLSWVLGAQGESLASNHSVVAEPKHFAGHGSPEGGTNTSPVHIGERELRTIMLKSFEPAIRQGRAMGVMAAYHEIDGIPITADPFLLKSILREEWGFAGFVLSDLGAIRQLVSPHEVAATSQQAACMGIRSGVDMQFYDFPHDVFQKALVDCVRDGSLQRGDLDRAVRSVLRVKFALGLFDNPLVDATLHQRVDRSPEHLAVSLRSALESMTLLRNENHLLPVSKSVRKIAVVGPNADVARYGDYEREENGQHISLLQGIRNLLPQAVVTFNEGSDIPAAVTIARQADVVILGLGENQGISGEGFDRSSLSLPGNQEQLLEAISAVGKPVVLVLENGRPLTIGWAKEHVPAILEAWYPGEFGGRAIAATLFGDNNPAGHVTVTFPKTVGQLPDYYNSDTSRVEKYVDDDGQPLFPFGFGLSYTTFRYDHLAVEPPPSGSGADVKVTVEVTNTGDREGDEVAQLYLHKNVSSVETPSRSLKGFSRIRLKAGESRTVTFRLVQEQMAVWNAEKTWEVEPGVYTVWVGGSSRATLSAQFYLLP
jgi:beta-glucosidase